MQMISMPNGIEVHSVNDHDHVVHVAGDDDDNADDDASQCCPNKIVKCPTTHNHTHSEELSGHSPLPSSILFYCLTYYKTFIMHIKAHA